MPAGSSGEGFPRVEDLGCDHLDANRSSGNLNQRFFRNRVGAQWELGRFDPERS
jgi:hypothetical protein